MLHPRLTIHDLVSGRLSYQSRLRDGEYWVTAHVTTRMITSGITSYRTFPSHTLQNGDAGMNTGFTLDSQPLSRCITWSLLQKPNGWSIYIEFNWIKDGTEEHASSSFGLSSHTYNRHTYYSRGLDITCDSDSMFRRTCGRTCQEIISRCLNASVSVQHMCQLRKFVGRGIDFDNKDSVFVLRLIQSHTCRWLYHP